MPLAKTSFPIPRFLGAQEKSPRMRLAACEQHRCRTYSARANMLYRRSPWRCYRKLREQDAKRISLREAEGTTMPLKVTDTTDGSPIFITGGEIEALDAQTVRIVLWSDLPATGERRIVARIAAATSVAIQLNLKMQQALADIINKLQPEDTVH